MRKDLETREIADAELDAVAGGLGGALTVSGGLASAVTTDVSNALNSLETVGFVQGLVGEQGAAVAGITGLNVNTGAITGLAGL